MAFNKMHEQLKRRNEEMEGEVAKISRKYIDIETKYNRSIECLNNVDIQNENLRAEVSKLERTIYELNIDRQNLESSKMVEMNKMKYEIESSRYE